MINCIYFFRQFLKPIYIISDSFSSQYLLFQTAFQANIYDFRQFYKPIIIHDFRQFFKPSVFTKLLQTDPYGRISIMQFFNYVMRKVWLHQTRIGLSLYDVAGQGYLKESVSAFIYICAKLWDNWA